jgi:basic membrane lipoprotein Med (substrate-binding protein (PBP1-ABC) superfamily)
VWRTALDNRVIRITLIRMTLRSLIVAGLLGLALVGVSQTASASPERRVVVVVDAAAGQAAVAEAEAAVAASDGEATLRVPRTATEQLSVTHYFAAQGYDAVIGVGLDKRVAVAPVAAKYPQTRFLAARPGHVAQTLG